MKSIIKKTIGLFFIAIAMTSCSKDENKAEEGIGECWYKVTIDGQTTLPNRFGQDNIILNSSSYPAEGDAGVLLSIIQTNANRSRDPEFDFSSNGTNINRETPVDTMYTADIIQAVQLSAQE